MATSPESIAPEPWLARHQNDLIAIGTFLVGVAIVMWHRWVYDNWLTEYDIFSFFLPIYGLLGDRLRQGDIPGWSPVYSSGSPIAGDPSSGWMYLPVMLTFSTMWVATAFKTMILIQLLIGGLATYAFARLIGYRPIAALMSTVAFAFGPFLAGQTLFATVACQVSTWIPVAFLGVELALRSRSLITRAAGCAIVGLAISQMTAAWPGQGMINGMLIVGLWIAYRGFVWPPSTPHSNTRRLIDVLVTGIGSLVIGLGLSAASLLPRLAINAQSNIANGDYSMVMRGEYEEYRHSLVTLLKELTADGAFNRPVALIPIMIVLGIMGFLLSGKRHAAPFWLGMVLIPAALSLPDSLIHRLFYLIPEFETLHDHGPKRVLWIISLAPAMLAGAAIQELPRHRGKIGSLWKVLTPLGIVCLVGAFLADQQPAIWIGWWVYGVAAVCTVLAIVIVSAPLGMPSWLGRETVTTTALTSMILIAFLAPAVRDVVQGIDRSDDPRFIGEFLSTDDWTSSTIDTYLARSEPNSTAAFLQQQSTLQGPFRYAGYSGRLYGPEPNPPSYSTRRRDPDVIAIMINGRAARLDLEMIQGYNPTHLLYYVQYSEAMNGRLQDYHWLDPSPTALSSSQLFDMLGVAYIVVSTTIPANRDDILAIAAEDPVVYRDYRTVVYQNLDAFDRAWIVHNVLSDADGSALTRLQAGSVNGHTTAFVNGTLPAFSPIPAGSAGESVEITHYEGDRITAQATAASDGLLVFSEIYAEGWNAWVDGNPVAIIRTNHALRGIPVTAGTHTIEMRYEPKELRNGLWISGGTGIAVLGIFGGALVNWRQGTSGAGSPSVPGQSSFPPNVPAPTASRHLPAGPDDSPGTRKWRDRIRVRRRRVVT